MSTNDENGSGTPEPVATTTATTTTTTTATTSTPDPVAGGEKTEPVRMGPVVVEDHVLRPAAPLEAGIRAEEALKEAEEEWQPGGRLWLRLVGMSLAGLMLVAALMAGGFFLRPTIFGWLGEDDPVAVEARETAEAEVEAAQAAKAEAKAKMAAAEARATELAVAADKATADAQASGVELATVKAELETLNGELEAAKATPAPVVAQTTPAPDPAAATTTATVKPAVPQVLQASVQYVKDPNGGYAYEYVPPQDPALPECEKVGKSKPQDFTVMCGNTSYRCLKSGMNSLTLLSTCTLVQ